ncbi:hypothetical protein DICVIV_12484 [Dictyocaulus viviparus]|uniref:ABC transmembrane type-1 domain-containing protein n=1 Tax=Dictyocaulus viviparus TaxID=29172 RepID=A0A0D8XAE4_DICVI|nr:hypothetical protein DICVIV_12484 [Dictyocaulus viviparus]
MTNVFLKAQNSEFVMGGGNTNPDGLQGITQTEFDYEVHMYSYYYLGLGLAIFITSYVQIYCMEIFAERITYRMRQIYLKAILRQEISWFDLQKTGSLTARLTEFVNFYTLTFYNYINYISYDFK